MKEASKKGLFLILSFISIGFLGLTTSSCTVDADPSVKQKEKIVVGADYDYKPFTYLDNTGQEKGFDVDIIKSIADKNNWELEFRFTEWDQALKNLEEGKVDLLLSVLYTDQRDTMYDYTIPYNEDYYGIFVRENSEVKDVSDLSQKQIITLEGDASITRFIKPMALFTNTTLVKSLPEAIRLLSEGEDDAVLAPYSIGMEAIEDLQIRNVEVVGPSIMPILYRFAVKEGDSNLLSVLNDGIDHVKASGKREEFLKKWNFHKRNEVSLMKVIRYVGIGLIPFFLTIALFILWTKTLRRNVAKQTKVLQKKTATLEKLNATKDKLFSVIGHDLRSPFNSILGYSDLLINNKNKYSDDKLKYFSKSIHSTAEKTLDLLDNLLCWAKSQTGQIKYQPEKIRLEEVIAQTVNFTTPSASIKNISLNHIPNHETEIHADRNMLKTILRNLISNAIKFTHSSGKVDIYSILGKNEVEITVSDNGTGMDEDTRKNIFQADANISSKGTENENGTGLGLILCKEFVEVHGGKIWVESEPGKGSDFHFTMPL
ncbi:MAG: transporter substrate-binding domain-containing protein [Bacteroidales bacterium]|nr:transporter substrate-binding domain-containing protein [Bacteroidales bacterium]